MPRLPVVTGKKLVKALVKLGFEKVRQRGTSHLIMKHIDGRRAVIAMHAGKEIPKGTLMGILRDIHITKEILLENL